MSLFPRFVSRRRGNKIGKSGGKREEKEDNQEIKDRIEIIG